ncbi:glutamate--tRNA ligase [Candidatus Venteria ishoeyi]|uniref:Glutamate--tRNA ligase n=1 Tax=Candidatus Venteria ishoeyi TaxID=1899563 RepID=A0A1H6FGL5_9GAMM|nr:glutamate--tRNA ligase [Candidatus Venteria ishoeyi]MDM8548146.1 glutamate--tRNA ligase [Candidatus Venteria ishoeyi]SEH09208.1 Glutamate--tRNA ligase [Candidatus Venteria ishoeyi]SEH09333.1 Glutamate--tRNA ligase [Candidatus Venteria ishoeyi]
MTLRTRFAPSPTGYLHIGGVRTALYSWLYARKHGGQFVLRIEDTDRERSTQASVDAILEGMAWLGLDADEGPFYQTQCFERYKAVIQQLLDEGKAYYCYCSKQELDEMREAQKARKEKPRYNGKWRDSQETPPAGVEPVIRFKNPRDGEVIFKDLIKGPISIQNAELDDLIIARADGTPTYNLTVVVDDMDMNISHVIRGDDHINNTPRQINILRALGATPPAYAHVPMILGDDGQRLSKRHGAVSVLQYKEEGYLPEAVLNYLVRLGWSHGDQEIFSIKEMIELFDISAVNRAASAFNTEKLQWLNQHYIKNAEPEALADILGWHLREQLNIDTSTGPALKDVVVIQQERAKTMREMAENSHFFYRDTLEYVEKPTKKNLKPTIIEPLTALTEKLEQLQTWQAEPIHECIIQTAEAFELKLGKLAQPLRVAVTGGAISPPIDVTVELIGRERSLQRLQYVLTALRENGSVN